MPAEKVKDNVNKESKKDRIHNKVLLLIEFYRDNGREPKKPVKYKNVAIGNFLNSIRSGNTKISNADRELLLNTGIRIESKNVKNEVHNKVLLLIEFYHVNGREPKKLEKYKDVLIGSFLNNIRSGNTKILNDDKKLLLKAGIRVDRGKVKNEVHRKVLLLIEFYNANAREPKQSEKYKDVLIGNFLNNIRSGNTKISNTDKKLLLKAGIRVNNGKIKNEVHNKVLLLIEFYHVNGREPKQSEKYKNVRVGGFLNSIRSGNTKISDSDRIMLEGEGIRTYSKSSKLM